MLAPVECGQQTLISLFPRVSHRVCLRVSLLPEVRVGPSFFGTMPGKWSGLAVREWPLDGSHRSERGTWVASEPSLHIFS